MTRIAGSLVLLALAGCAHCPVDVPIGLPERPDLIPVSQEQFDSMRPDVQDTVTLNDLWLKEYARQLEERIRLHNEALEKR